MMKGMDVFGDITLPTRNGSPRGMSPIGKGKGVLKEYGDRWVSSGESPNFIFRFIPTRDGSDLHVAYQLLPDVDAATGKEVVSKPKGRRKSAYGQGTDQDVRRGEDASSRLLFLRDCWADDIPVTL